jgi:hypothetical protein
MVGRPFRAERDTIAFPNKTVWKYNIDQETGVQTSKRRVPRPDYTQRCILLAGAARKFHLHAQFDPELSEVDEEEERRRVREILRRSRWKPSTDVERVMIPGYEGLWEFSEQREKMLKRELGTPWKTYLHRGNYKLLHPFSRRHQERTAQRMRGSIEVGIPSLIRVVRFPSLTINHAILAHAVRDEGEDWVFIVYDPNQPGAAVELHYGTHTRLFQFVQNDYFRGGHVDVYEVFRGPSERVRAR